MKLTWIFIFIQNIIVPAIIGAFCLKLEVWWWAIPAVCFYFVGVIISVYKQWIYISIPILFVIWYWYTYGIGINEVVTLSFFAMIAGITLNQIGRKYKEVVHKVIPEQFDNIAYDEKVEELNRRLDLFRKQNPNAKLTQDIIDKIRTEVFFG